MVKYVRTDLEKPIEPEFNLVEKYSLASREGIKDWRDFTVVYAFMTICIIGFVFVLYKIDLIQIL